MPTKLENILEVRVTNLASGYTFKIDKNNDYHLIDVQGMESAVMESRLNSNVLFDGAVAESRRVNHRNIVFDFEYDGGNKLGARQQTINTFNVHQDIRIDIRYGDNRKKIFGYTEELHAPPVNVHNDFRARVSIICPNPYFLDYDDTTTSLITWSPAWIFPMTIPNHRKHKGLVFGRRKKKSFINLYNEGDVETGMIITLKASSTVKNPFILNVDTREHITVEGTMQSGEVYIIDTNPGNKGIEILNNPDGIKNGYRLMSEDSSFIQLRKGDNIIRYGAEEGVDNLDISIEYSNKYLGV